MKGTSTLAAAPVLNVLAGLDYAQLPWPALVSLFATVSAITASLGFKFDSVSIAEDGTVPNIASATGIVRQPEDMLFFEEFTPAFTNLKLRGQGTAAAETLNWWVAIKRLA